ncbi:ABC-type uncharacterized transport system, periplasmic component [Lactobacillus selangorensis]|uniref:ABC-type uncharacterized transport system, periplasmic component n=1 Tax=Lactobacillus selangorensis TaxID=81857 RepID=A0A0R2FQC4_9LACO|nr:tryptophan ABC transporter substrate-binding protein [Lactobacillus selangorensis]KRN27212.1 ABC-type uncharacterized transport system, periplasmic component [Lactobacillus selangorensis]KRN29866.1 ABC-type uncharacterized transport system, periplasmic component [Lactobacillus selangorensis]
MKRLRITLAILTLFLLYAFVQQAQPQQKAAKPTVGILQLTTHPALDAIHKGIIAELKKRGYVPGQNVKIDFQNAEGDQSNLKSMSERFQQEGAAVRVGIATPAAQALAATTKTAPIVLGAVTDPKGAKLVKDNAHPGGNITGVSDQAPIAAQLKLIRQLLPNLKTLGVIYTSSDDSAVAQVKLLKPLAQKAGFTLKTYSISSTNDMNQAAEQMAGAVQAVYVPTDNTVASAMQTLVAATNKAKIPVFPSVDTMVKQGGVATISVDQYQLGIETGKQVADILDGKAPAKMPIHFVRNGKLVVNVKQARKIGLTIPAQLVQQAQQKGEVIQ